MRRPQLGAEPPSDPHRGTSEGSRRIDTREDAATVGLYPFSPIGGGSQWRVPASTPSSTFSPRVVLVGSPFRSWPPSASVSLPPSKQAPSRTGSRKRSGSATVRVRMARPARTRRKPKTRPRSFCAPIPAPTKARARISAAARSGRFLRRRRAGHRCHPAAPRAAPARSAAPTTAVASRAAAGAG
jgi:hypothetical protein